jgi:hypothetical protein
MAEKIDDLTVNYFQDDVEVIKEVDKQILSRGSWTTIMFLYREKEKESEEFGPEKVSIRRYQKRSGVFKQQSKFNISSAKQARQVVEALEKWFPPEQE